MLHITLKTAATYSLTYIAMSTVKSPLLSCSTPLLNGKNALLIELVLPIKLIARDGVYLFVQKTDEAIIVFTSKERTVKIAALIEL
ncbi:MAG: hypothetical protein RR540_06680 [Oscillospiraceae bacterium]